MLWKPAWWVAERAKGNTIRSSHGETYAVPPVKLGFSTSAYTVPIPMTTNPPTPTTSVTRTADLAAFVTTRWSLVARAGGPASEERRLALADLCESYWYPVYAFARRKGHAAEEARDLVQGFFADFLEREDVTRADADLGRFRSYLLGAFVHFATNEWNRAQAVKRGGDRQSFSLDHEMAEGRFQGEDHGELGPEASYERAWALSLIESVIVRLRAEYEERGRGEVFDRLRPMLSFDGEAESYQKIAHEMGTTEGAVKVAVHRLRGRFASLLRRAIADTVCDPAEVEEEIRGLFEALG